MLTDDAGGGDNPFIKTYKDAFPAEKLAEVTTTTNLDLNGILPTNRRYYAYTGSLTTPPCSQGLKWLLLKGKVNVSAAQVTAISAKHGKNNRPLQPIGNRIVLEKK
jgi:carbonic anhydrase